MTLTTEQTQRLIKALEIERETFADKHHSTEEHDVTIVYLQTNEYNMYEYHEYELLKAAVCDIECLYSDYCGHL